MISLLHAARRVLPLQIQRCLAAFLFALSCGAVNAIPIDSADTLLVDGREWSQVDLFNGLSWTNINAVCPGGVCGSGTLNGYDMAGWTWASTETVNDLFNYYLGFDALGPGPDYWKRSGTIMDATEPVRSSFMNGGGWRSTDVVNYLGSWVYFTMGHMADAPGFFGQARYAIGFSFSGPIINNSFSTDTPDEPFYTNDPSNNSRLDIGAWFYRAPAPVSVPSSLWLLAVSLFGWAGLGRVRAALALLRKRKTTINRIGLPRYP